MSVRVKIEHTLKSHHVDQLAEIYTHQLNNPRTPTDISLMLLHTTLVFALIDEDSDRLLAFARVLTDFLFKALILDVVVDEAYRGQGLGRRLLEAIITHDQMRAVRSIDLTCYPELIPFYKHFGFEHVDDGHIIMRVRRK